MSKLPQDERIVKTSFSSSPGREDRAASDDEKIQNDGTANSIAEKIAALRDGWSDNVLPDVKGDPNFHYCWLSTTNQSDPIYRRLRLGYELVRSSELPYLGSQNRVQSGEFEGCVSVNELILAKIPMELYNEMMLINHYEKPMQEEQLLKANMDSGEEDSNGRQLGEKYGDGINNLGRVVRRPNFIED